MGESSKIEWTHHTFNPWWGCTRVSPGCTACYAETFARRTGLGWGPQAERRLFGEKHWREPLKWDRDAAAAGEMRRVFCASMADVFEDRQELESERLKLWNLIHTTPSLIWLLLTKRPENASRMVPTSWSTGWPRNVWAMTTAEDRQRAQERIPILLQLPAVVHGVSYEPALEDVYFGPWLYDRFETGDGRRATRKLKWIIVGGESGGKARPFHLEWARSVRDQCRAAGCAVFVKQLGRNPEIDRWTEGDIRSGFADKFGNRDIRLRDSKGGDWSEWPEDLRVREMPIIDKGSY